MELKKRKGLFYTADALLAVSILFIFMLLAVPMVKVKTQSSDLQYDIISALSATEIGDLEFEDDSAQIILNGMIANGRINDSSKSALEALGLLYIQDRASGQWLAEKIFEGIDSEYNFGIWIGDNLIYSKGSVAYNEDTSRYIDSAGQIVSGVQEGKNITGFAARAYLAKTMNTKYYYFGGYVGDGNISIRTDYEGNISSAEIEVAISTNFDLYVNNNYIGNYNGSTSNYYPVRYILPTTNFNSGENTIEFRNATNKSSISGGFVKINYKSDIESSETNRYYFPGIRGVINVYDGFYLPGSVSSMNVRLNFSSPQNISLFVGNKSVYQGNSSGAGVVIITNANLASMINYSQLSDRNIPIRIGMDAAIESSVNRIGNADVVIVTDVSGSMAWNLTSGSSSSTGINILNCNDWNVWNRGNTSRLSLARCINRNFTAKILSGAGNRVALVSYDNDAVVNLGFTNDSATINNTIMNFSTGSGTCISCGINAAYDLLNNSNFSRTRFIVVMTDGQANYRGAPTCEFRGISSFNNIFTIQVANSSGRVVSRTAAGFWTNINQGSRDFTDVAALNGTYAFTTDLGTNIYRWNGATWASSYNSDEILNGVDTYLTNFAVAVGDDGEAARWNGATWSSIDQGSNSVDFTDVAITNSTHALATLSQSAVYRWNGATWASSYSAENPLRGIDAYNGSFAIAVGDDGEAARWSGVSWTDIDQGSNSVDFTDVAALNITYAFATTRQGDIYRWNGATWTNVYDGMFYLNATTLVNSTYGYAVGDTAGLLVVWNGSVWNISMPDYLFNTSGVECGDQDSCSSGNFTNNGAAYLANVSAYRAYQNLNLTIHSVGFSIDKCVLGNNTIKAIADSGHGNWTSSSDPSTLSKFFQDVADTVLEVSFAEQKSFTVGNLFSILYPDSYIEFNYNEPALPNGLRFSIEEKFASNESNEEFALLPGDSVIEARMTSYSGAKWTDKVYLNNSLIYNLSYYGTNFTLLGDPFNIYLPKNMLNLPGNNRVNLTLYPTGIPGSRNNSVVYTIVRNITAYSNIGASASGCNWSIKTQANGVINIPVPPTYSGSNICYYNATSPNYGDGTYQDVYILAAYSLLEQLDSDGNGEIDINLEKDYFEIDTTTVSGIPFEWRTEVSVRVWE